MLFSKKIEPKCEYCRKSSVMADNESVACIKHGIMSPEDKCRSFRYDPLKRIPEAPRSFSVSDFSEKDFSL